MAKRKAAVNDIIYELDDDVVLSSDEEVTQPKICRSEQKNSANVFQSDSTSQDSAGEGEVIDIDSSLDIINCEDPSPNKNNGGKSSDDIVIIEEDGMTESCKGSEVQECEKKHVCDGNKTTIFNEDIDIDSPGNSDLGVVGCENRAPLITVRFKDSRLAMSYKKQIKAFMLNLIKLHEHEEVDLDNETDLELDIWPEDLVEGGSAEEPQEDNSFFFVDTDPCFNAEVVPRYESKKDESIISNEVEQEPTKLITRRGPVCFNCDGDHQLRQCKLPKNYARINEMRTKRMNRKTERYHMEDEQKYGHIVPGRISGKLRSALGLRRNELPTHIYRMRKLGYPPAWLEEARISHSGMMLYDSSGQATLEPDEEEGEVCEPGSKDKFDIRKIWDFPGFNIPPSQRYIDQWEMFNLPPMSEHDSKMLMLQTLAPNAMKAYKRKKLTFFPSATADTAQGGGQAEMDIDSGDDTPDLFPSVPPLPDEAPPPPPPPPPPLPSTPPDSEDSKKQPHSPKSKNSKKQSPTTKSENDSEMSPTTKTSLQSKTLDDSGENFIKLHDIPVPMSDFIVLDEEGEISEPTSGRGSPSLDDLVVKKKLLLEALSSELTQLDEAVPSIDESIDNVENNDGTEMTPIEDLIETEDTDKEPSTDVTDSAKVDDEKTEISNDTQEIDLNINDNKSDVEPSASTEDSDATVAPSTQTSVEELNNDKLTEVTKTPEPKSKNIKGTEYGTPVVNSISPFSKLPSDDKFAKDICDVINFENLPNSTGKYKKISTLLKKVKDEVDRIQES